MKVIRDFYNSFNSSDENNEISKKRKKETNLSKNTELVSFHSSYVESLYSRTLLFPLGSDGGDSGDDGAQNKKNNNGATKKNKKKNNHGVIYEKKSVDNVQALLGKRLNETLGYQQWKQSTSLKQGGATTAIVSDPWSNNPSTSHPLFDSSGYLQFSSLFKKTPSWKVKIEFGSGTGDWCAAQAAADQGVVVGGDNGNMGQLSTVADGCGGESSVTGSNGGGNGGGGNWCAVELRADRISTTFSRACLHHSQSNASSTKESNSSLDNLALIQCNAHVLMSRHISPRSLGAIFVNHPEPPQQVNRYKA